MEKFDKTGGRSIEGILPTKEKFSQMEEGRDYEFVLRNKQVNCARDIKDFVNFVNPEYGEVEKDVEAPHWRTISEDIDSTVSVPYGKEKNRQPFFCVSSKGVGYLKPSALGNDFHNYETWVVEDNENVNDSGVKVLGLSSKLDYFLYHNQNIVDKSMFLAGQGLRTEIYWGVEKMKQLYWRGELKTIRELKDLGVIPDKKNYAPHMAQRVLKTNTRVEEVYKSDERRDDLFKKAFDVFNKEQDFYGKDERLDIREANDQKKFCLEFIRRCAKNAAIMMNLGYISTTSHSSNITLAGEIVDIGPMGHWSEDVRHKSGWDEKYKDLRLGYIKDLRDLTYSIKFLRIAMKKAGMSRPDKEVCFNEFIEAFNKIINEKQLKEQETDISTVRDFAEKIFKSIIVEGVRLPSLNHYDMEDWPDLFKEE